MNLHFKEICIGSNLKSLIFSYKKNIPLILINPTPPFEFGFFDSHIDLSSLNIKQKVTALKTNKGYHEVGFNKFELYNTLILLNSLSGLLPFNNLIEDMSCDFDGKEIEILSQSKRHLVEYETVYLIDVPESRDIERQIESSYEDRIMVADWFKIKRGSKHPVDFHSRDNNFIKEVYYYSRPDNPFFKDAVAVSYLAEQHVEDFDYSPVVTRYGVKKIMEETNAELSTSVPKIELVSKKRQYFRKKNMLRNTMQNAKVVGASIEEILCQNFQDPRIPYTWLDAYQSRVSYLIMNSPGTTA